MPKRWAANLMKQDASLHDIYAAEELTSLNPGKICWQVHQLKEVWQQQRPKLKRLSCDSFVLSIKVHQEKQLYCGLNNGSLQASPCSFIQILSQFFLILACFIYFSQKFFCTMGHRNFCTVALLQKFLSP